VCPEYKELYRSDRARALDPAAEYQRWLDQDKAAERDDRRAAAVVLVDERRAAGAARFARPRDILAD
jgi:hypothetical protein